MAESILIVEDNTDFRATLMNLLRRRGFSVHGAGDYTEAMDLVRSESFALVISDVRLPGPDGIEIMTNILEECKGIKTLLITGYADSDVPVKAIKIGVDDFIYKPFAMELFLHSVNKLILGHRLEKSVEYYRELSILDGVTGLFNHRYFHETIGKEMSRAKRYAHPLTLLILDIDNFKKVNDTHGHLMGDSVLKKIGQILLATLRSVDLVFRYGGEEFAVLAPEQSTSDGMIMAERILAKIRKGEFQVDECSSEKITVSIGCASYRSGSDSKEDFIHRADAALYVAKRSGKDMVCLGE